jgi:hypothetical protein
MRAAEPARLLADWPAPPGVVAFPTLRTGPGASRRPSTLQPRPAQRRRRAAAQANRDALHAAIGTPRAALAAAGARHRSRALRRGRCGNGTVPPTPP